MCTPRDYMGWVAVDLLTDNWTWLVGTTVALLIPFLVHWIIRKKELSYPDERKTEKRLSRDNRLETASVHINKVKMSSTTSEEEFFDPEYQPPVSDGKESGNDDITELKAADGIDVEDDGQQHVTGVSCVGRQLAGNISPATAMFEGNNKTGPNATTVSTCVSTPHTAAAEPADQSRDDINDCQNGINIDPGNQCRHASLETGSSDDVFGPNGLDCRKDLSESECLESGIVNVNPSEQQFQNTLSTTSSQQFYSATSDTEEVSNDSSSSGGPGDQQLSVASHENSTVKITESSVLTDPLELVDKYEKNEEKYTASDSTNCDTPNVNTEVGEADRVAEVTGEQESNDKHSTLSITKTSEDTSEPVDICIRDGCTQLDISTHNEAGSDDYQEMCHEPLSDEEHAHKTKTADEEVIQIPTTSEQSDTVATQREIPSDNKTTEELVTDDNLLIGDQKGHANSPDTSSLSSFLPGFKDKMASYGVNSQSLNTLVAKSSVTLSPTRTEAPTPFRRQNTFPLRSPQRVQGVTDNRTIKVVRMSSTDSSGAPTASKPNRSASHNGHVDTNDSAIDILTASTSLSDSGNHASSDDVKGHAKTKTDINKSVGGMMDNIDSSTVLNILDNIGQKLEQERQKRERAEDWAEFLTSELEAHIEARTSTEARYTVLRQRYIDFKHKSKEKYLKLQSDYKALLLQINEITHDGSPPNKDSAPQLDSPKPFVNRGVLRRNRSQGDRSTLMAKRNAMLIRGSRRQASSDSGSEEEDNALKSPTTPDTSKDKPDVKEPIAENLDSVKASWEKQFKKKQDNPKPESEKNVISDRPSGKDSRNSPQRSPRFDKKSRLSVTISEDKEVLGNSASPKAPFTSTPKTSRPEVASPLSPPALDQRPFQASDLEKSDTGENAPPEKKVVNVKAFTNMWEQKLSSVPFKTMTSAQHGPRDGSKGVGVFRTGSFNRSSTTGEPQGTPNKKHRQPKLDKNDNLEVSLDDLDLDYLSQDTELDDELLNGISSLSNTEGVLNDSINTKLAFNMFEKGDSATSTPRDGALADKSPRRLSYSASVREARSKFANVNINGSSVDQPRKPRSKTESASSDVSPCSSPKVEPPNGGSDRSARFSSLMSKWQSR